MSRGLIRFLFLACAVILLAGCGKRQDGSREPAQEPMEATASTDSVTFELTGQHGMSVLDLLKKQHAVEYRSSAMGAFVISIDSITNGGGYFWLYAVNDSAAQIACDRYITDSNDRIQWRFRKPGS